MKIGDEVICIDDSDITNGLPGVNPPIKKGRHYVIYGMKKVCCIMCVDVGMKSKSQSKICVCGKVELANSNIWWMSASRFVPIEHIPESHEQAVKELIEQSILVEL